MASALTLQELAAKVEESASKRFDAVANTERLTLLEDGTILMEMDEGDTTFRPTKTAHAQIADRLKVPKRFYDRLQEQHPDILSDVVTGLFRKEPETRMVRAYTDESGVMPMRAFLSSRFRRIDNYELMRHAILPELLEGQSTDLRVMESQVTDSRMYIKVVTPRLTAEPRVGDPVQGGFLITNSEIGKGSLNVSMFMLRLVCTNGMVGNSLLRKYHVGRNVDTEAEVLFSQETLQADDRAIMLKARDMIRNALSEDGFMKEIEAMKQASGVVIEHPRAAVEVLSQDFSLNQSESDSLMESFFKNSDRDGQTLYGLTNALTDMAKNVESYDRKVELEGMGHRLIHADKGLVNKIREAA